MGWKTINGRRYFYKSERSGGRVTTRYFGAGEPARVISLLDAEDRDTPEEWRFLMERFKTYVQSGRQTVIETRILPV
jgi:hypothetical protein